MSDSIDPADFVARAANLTPDTEEWAGLERDLTERVAGERPAVRRDCAFCGRERSAKDDNHAPECSYWDFFGPR